MKSILTLLLLFLSTVVFAQSSRKTNKVLNKQYNVQLARYDSLWAVYDKVHPDYLEKRNQVKKGRDEVSSLVSDSKSLKIQVDYLYGLLVELDQAAPFALQYDSLYKMTLVERFQNYKDINQYKTMFTGEKVEWNAQLIEISGLDKTLRNYCLDSLVRIMGFYNEKFGKDLTSQKDLLDKFELINAEILALTDSTLDYRSTYYSLLSKLRLKRDELKQNYSEKGPNGFSPAYSKIFPGVFAKESYKNGPEFSSKTVSAEPPAYITPPTEIYEVVDVPAEFTGGETSYNQFIISNLKYPEDALDEGIGGRVYLRFIVSEYGIISNVKVVKGIIDCKECDDEAVRLVRAMPKWKPALLNGKEVNSYYNLPIKFKPD